MAEKKKGIWDAAVGLFVMRDADGRVVENDAAPPEPTNKQTGDAVVDDLLSRYGQGGTAGPGRARSTTRPPASPAQGKAATGKFAAVSAGAPREAAPSEPVGSAAIEPVAIDLETVFAKQGLSSEDRDRVEKALTLLHTLPMETPVSIKRQIVAASLQAFAIPVEQIIEASLLQQQAFDRHLREAEKQTQILLEHGQKRLAELEQETLRVQQQMQAQRAQQQGLALTVHGQKERIQEVLDFFGAEAAERVTQTSVKLRALAGKDA